MTVQLSALPHSFHSPFYSLAIYQMKPRVAITMRSRTQIVNTADLPFTYTILKELLPDIFKTRCFNYAQVSFAKEVKRTEIGHLFEHILLTYLCEIQRTRGVFDAMYKAETSWNWHRDALGTFHIVITIGTLGTHVFQEALTRSITLLNLILRQRKISTRLA